MDLISLLRQQIEEEEANEDSADGDGDDADAPDEPAADASSGGQPPSSLLGDDDSTRLDPLTDVDDVPPGEPG